jgi:hypothetical protein
MLVKRAAGRPTSPARRRDGLGPVGDGETISGWRKDRRAERLGFADHALVVGDQYAELTRDACGRGEMDRVERAQRRPTHLRSGRQYRLDRKQPQPSKYADCDGGSVTAEAACSPSDLDRGEQA